MKYNFFVWIAFKKLKFYKEFMSSLALLPPNSFELHANSYVWKRFVFKLIQHGALLSYANETK